MVRELLASLRHCSIFLCVFLSTVVDGEKNILEQKLGLKVDTNCAQTKLGAHNYGHVMDSLRRCKHDLHYPMEFVSMMGNKANLYIEIFCRAPPINICANIVAKNFDSCLSDDQLKYLKHVADFYLAEWKFACQENKQPFRDILNSNWESCVKKNKSEVAKCDFHLNLILNDSVENRHSERNCRSIEERAQCLANLAGWCLARNVDVFLLNTTRAGLSATPCSTWYPASDDTTLIRSDLYVTALLFIVNFLFWLETI